MNLPLATVVFGTLVFIGAGGSTVYTVSPRSSLNTSIKFAEDGDTIIVDSGYYPEHIEITKRIVLIGKQFPVIDGKNRGSVVKLKAPGIIFKGFKIINSGDYLGEENSGIEVLAHNIRVENNSLEDVLFGIYLRRANRSVIRNNVIAGKPLPKARRGDLIRVWYSDSVVIENNVLKQGRDVVIWFSNGLKILRNTISDGRYGIHFMYCDDAEIYENILTHNSVGAFLMYSRRLKFKKNFVAYNRHGSGFGIGVKDVDDPLIGDNLFVDNKIGVFIDNSPREIDSKSTLVNNVFAYNDFGVGLLPSVRRNIFEKNSFIDNEENVQIEGGGTLSQIEWRGNYWSDYSGLDLDNDNVGDIPYLSQRLFENLMDKYPQLRMFLYSPITQAIDFAAKVVPMVQPVPKVVDSTPMMSAIIPSGIPAPPRSENYWTVIFSAIILSISIGLIFYSRSGRTYNTKAQSSTFDTDVKSKDSVARISNLRKKYGDFEALKEIDFTVQQGEALALWGPNGAGKTTILRCMLGLTPFEGEIIIGGLNVRTSSKQVRGLMGFVPQELAFYEDFTVQETLELFSALRKGAPKRTPLLLELMGLEDKIHLKVNQLSGGMKQRLALAIALISDPHILLLDEPTANLDMESRESFLSLLRDLKNNGKTLIFTSHRFQDIRMLADRVIVLKNGKILSVITPYEVSGKMGWKTKLMIYTEESNEKSALNYLKEKGYDARLDGTGIFVTIPSMRKIDPIEDLISAGFKVIDFEIEESGENG